MTFDAFQEHIHAEARARSLVGDVSTPTMLLTGEADYGAPISESEQYYQALRLREVKSVRVRIPAASHGIAAMPELSGSDGGKTTLYMVKWPCTRDEVGPWGKTANPAHEPGASSATLY